MVHYFIYLADYKFHLLFRKINPVTLIHKLPFQKKMYEKRGINIGNEINEAFKNQHFGISTIRAGGFIGLLLFFLLLGLTMILCGLINSKYSLKSYHFYLIGVISWIVNYYILFKKRKYLKYFKEFDKMQKKEKIKWALYSFLTILCIIVFFILSFIYFA